MMKLFQTKVSEATVPTYRPVSKETPHAPRAPLPHGFERHKVDILKTPLSTRGPKSDDEHVTKLWMEHTKRSPWAVQEKLILRHANACSHPLYASGMYFDQHKALFGFGETLFKLCDKDGTTLALCVKDKDAFTILGTHPLSGGDAALTHDAESLSVYRDPDNHTDYYPWYQLRDNQHAVHRPLFVWNGHEYAFVARLVPSLGVSSSEFGPTEQGDLMLHDAESNTIVAHFSKRRETYKLGKGVTWTITIGRGFDPATVLCIAAVVDYMVPMLSTYK